MTMNNNNSSKMKVAEWRGYTTGKIETMGKDIKDIKECTFTIQGRMGLWDKTANDWLGNNDHHGYKDRLDKFWEDILRSSENIIISKKQLYALIIGIPSILVTLFEVIRAFLP